MSQYSQYNQYIYRNGEGLLIGDGAVGYSLSKSGNTLTLTGSDGSTSSVTLSDADIKGKANTAYNQGDIVSYNNNGYVANRNVAASQTFTNIGSIDVIKGYQPGDELPANSIIYTVNDWNKEIFANYASANTYFENLVSDPIDNNFFEFHYGVESLDGNSDHSSFPDPDNPGETVYAKQKTLLKLDNGFQINLMFRTYTYNNEHAIYCFCIPCLNGVVPTSIIDYWGESEYMYDMGRASDDGSHYPGRAGTQTTTLTYSGTIVSIDDAFQFYYLADPNNIVKYQNNFTNKDGILLDFPTQHYIEGSFESTDELYNQKGILNNNLNSVENKSLMPGSLILKTKNNLEGFNLMIDFIGTRDYNKIGDNSSNSNGYNGIDPEEGSL